MKKETQTHFFRRHRGIKIVLDYCFSKLELIIVTALLALFGAYNHHKESKDVNWIGDNLKNKTTAITQLQESK